MNLKSLLLTSSLLFSNSPVSNIYSFNGFFDGDSNFDALGEKYQNQLNNFYFSYNSEDGLYYLYNDLALSVDGLVGFDYDFMSILGPIYSSGNTYSKMAISYDSEDSTYVVSFAVETFTNYPSTTFSSVIVYHFDEIQAFDYAVDYEQSQNIKIWAEEIHNQNKVVPSVSDNVFDIVGETVSSYVGSITTMFNKLMLLFYADNKLTYLSQLLLVGIGIGITKWGMNFVKDRVRL